MTKEEIDASLNKTLGLDPGDDIFKKDNEALEKILADTSDAISEMNKNTVDEKKKMGDMIVSAKSASDQFLAKPTKSTSEFAQNSLVAAQDTLASISEQTKLMSATVQHIYEIITSSGIVDPDLVSSFAVLVSSAKDLWAMKLDVYKMMLGQIQAINMENLKQAHRLELEEKKFELKKRLANETKNTNVDCGDKKYIFDNAQFLKSMSAMKRGNVDIVDVPTVEPNIDREKDAFEEPEDSED